MFDTEPDLDAVVDASALVALLFCGLAAWTDIFASMSDSASLGII